MPQHGVWKRGAIGLTEKAVRPDSTVQQHPPRNPDHPDGSGTSAAVSHFLGDVVNYAGPGSDPWDAVRQCDHEDAFQAPQVATIGVRR